jgi:hypothetical protein
MNTENSIQEAPQALKDMVASLTPRERRAITAVARKDAIDKIVLAAKILQLTEGSAGTIS